jgi:hypothetical protein
MSDVGVWVCDFFLEMVLRVWGTVDLRVAIAYWIASNVDIELHFLVMNCRVKRSLYRRRATFGMYFAALCILAEWCCRGYSS